MSYGVYENNKLCTYKRHKVSKTWNKAIYPTFQGAKKYAMQWLGEYADIIRDWKEKDEQSIDITGYGDVLTIRKIVS